MALVSLTLDLTPHGRLLLVRDDDASLLEAELAHRIENAFGRGAGYGLLHLGENEVGVALPPALSFWREFAALYVTGVCTRPGAAEGHCVHIPPPASSELDQFVLAAPPMTGAEYLSAALLSDLWHALDRAFCAELAEAKCGVEEFLKGLNPAWNLVGRVHFNLAYTARLSGTS
jgi:non-specific serine/threonine protein kinase